MQNDTASNFLQLLNPDNTMSFNRLLAHAIGANETIIYFCLISKMTYYETKGVLDEQGFFYATYLDIQESTTFTKRQQVPAIQRLVEIGLIETKLKGIPAKKYYRVLYNQDLILSLLENGKVIAENIKIQAKSNVTPRSNKMSQQGENEENSQLEHNVTPRNDKMSQQGITLCNTKEEQNVTASNNLMLQQDVTECCNKEGQNVETSSDKMLRKSKYNNLKLNNHNQSIYQSTPLEDELIDRLNRTRESVKKNIEYEALVFDSPNDKDRLDEIVEIMTETIELNKKPININGNQYPAELVKSRFLKLDKSDIDYVLFALSKNTTKINNIRAYLLSTLYNSKNTIDNYYTAEVKSDMYGGV